jgi:hypothetical protein
MADEAFLVGIRRRRLEIFDHCLVGSQSAEAGLAGRPVGSYYFSFLLLLFELVTPALARSRRWFRCC